MSHEHETTDEDWKAVLEEDVAAMGQDTRGLQELGEEAWQLDQSIQALDAEVKAKKKALTELLEKKIPEAMTEQALGEFGFTTPDGGRARLETHVKVVGSLRYAPDQEAAVKFLEESGFTGGVKTVVSVDFTEGEREAAETLSESILHISGREPIVGRELNAQTLMAFARKKLKDEPEWDYSKVGITALPMARFSRRK